MSLRRIIVESPWAGRGPSAVHRWWNHWGNRIYTRDACLHSIYQGESPFAGHLFYTQFLDDDHLPDRNRGMRAAREWLAQAELVAVYIDRGLTPGMKLGIEWATASGIPFEYRSLNK